jgi:hypothetical protein
LFGSAAALAVAAAAGPYAGIESPPASALAVPAASAPAARVVVITARDYAFDMPDTLTAGRTELQLVNRGAELHHAALLRLDAGKTAADFLAALKAGGPPPAWAHDAGGPNAPAPGATSAAVVDLAPGGYVLVCFIPSPDGTPHVMKGMTRAFTVAPARAATFAARTAAPAPLVAGAPDVTMTLTDYAFQLSRPLTRGRHVLRVRNAASQPHEVFVVRLAPGKTAAEALAWVEKMQGPPPMQPLGGVVGMATGVANDIALDLTPGEYALFCFIPDARDGKPHVAHGMVRQFSVR